MPCHTRAAVEPLGFDDLESMAALRAEFRSVASHASIVSDEERARLREAVCHVVKDLKGRGVMPEVVIVSVRQTARDSGIGVSGDLLVSTLAAWCIADYYETS